MSREGESSTKVVTTTIGDAFRLAVHYEQTGRLTDAESICRQIVEADRDNVAVLHLFGVVRLRADNFSGAVEVLERAAALAPDNTALRHHLGLAYAGLGSHERAVAAFEAALAGGETARVLSDLAKALANLGRADEAADRFVRALELDPKLVDAWANLGRLLGSMGRHEEAARHLMRALDLAPDLGPQIYYSLGVALKSLGRDEQALTCFENAVKANPDNTPARSNLGTTLLDLGRVNEAVHCFREAASRAPNSAEVHYNLGNAFLRQRRIDKAIEAYRHALAVNSESPDAHWNLAHVLLLSGDFANGWREYEWRWGIAAAKSSQRAFDKPRWDGEDLNGRTILLWAEQGFGDFIHFARYVPWVAAKGGTVVLECWSVLKRLFAGFPGVARMIVPGDPAGDFDVQLPLLSLPLVHGTTLETIPADIPYLKSDPALAATWATALTAPARLRVGLSWQGNRGHPRDRERSVPLDAFRPLLAVPDVVWYSLQKEDDAALYGDIPPELRPILPRLPSGESIQDFADTAAIMANMDLIITVDSGPAHLAGALGRPVWLLVPFSPEWRWLLNRSDSPWYPTMRLFRQSAHRDWAGVVRDIREALRVLLSEAVSDSVRSSPARSRPTSRRE